MRNSLFKKLLSGPYIFWIVGFTVLPLLVIAYYAFTQNGQFTLANITAITQYAHWKALAISLVLALLCTFVCLLISFPLALVLRNLSLAKGHLARGRNNMIVMLFILPMWINFLLRSYAWQMILSRNGLLNGFLSLLHLPKLHIYNTPWAILLGMIYDFLPFMILPVYNAMIKIDQDVINAAYDLGATKQTTLRKIIFPLSLPGIISGITMVFVPSISEFAIANLLGGGKILLIGNIIEQEFSEGNNWNLGSGLSLILMIFIIISMLFTAKYDKNGEGGTLL
ncbi:MAG: ABC transporter permease [Lachnospiraceae bacterium]|nr:ABC transporter permease [Lachnospiraceae bacterium]